MIRRYAALTISLMFLSCISHGNRMQDIGLTLEQRANCTNILAMRDATDEIAEHLIEMEFEQEDRNGVVGRYLRKEAKWYLFLNFQLDKLSGQKCKRI